MSFKTVYLFDSDGFFAGTYNAQEDPMQEGSYITPTASTDVQPVVQDGHTTRWSGASWVLEPIAPVVVVQPTIEQIKADAIARVRSARKPVFYTLAGMQSEALATGDTATALAIVDIQQALKDMPSTDLSACTTADEVSAVFLAQWLAIANMAPENVRTAFNEVLA